jgi:hypothetical protein
MVVIVVGLCAASVLIAVKAGTAKSTIAIQGATTQGATPTQQIQPPALPPPQRTPSQVPQKIRSGFNTSELFLIADKKE